MIRAWSLVLWMGAIGLFVPAASTVAALLVVVDGPWSGN